MIFRFANCMLESRRRELRVDGVRVHLEPQVWDVLHCLIRHRDRVVTRDDLIETVWNGRCVSDSVISARIFAARRAMGDDGRTQTLIRTIPRRGYRFVAPVTIEEAPCEEAEVSRNPESARLAFDVLRAPALRALSAGAAALALALFGGFWWETENSSAAWRSTSVPTAPVQVSTRPSLAVLPLRDVSGGVGTGRAGEGLTSALITALSRSPSLYVIAQGSTRRDADTAEALRAASDDLGVRYVVEGTVRRSGDRLRVDVHLVNTASGTVLWGESYERDRADLLALEDEISARIARSLDIRLSAGSTAGSGGTRNLDALAAYMDGKAAYETFTPEGNRAAQRHFVEALEIDPDFARAMIGIANTHLIEMIGAPAEAWTEPLREISRLQDQAARRAPGMPELFKLRSMLALAKGDMDLALSEAEAMVALDPNGAESNYVLGQMLFFAGQYDRAAEHLKVAERLNPDRRASYSTHLAFVLLAEGEEQAALSILESVREQWPEYLPGPAYLAIGYQFAGRPAAARREMSRVTELAPQVSIRSIERRFAPMQDRALAARFVDAARQAGLPECCPPESP